MSVWSAPEHDWAAAAAIIMPILLPVASPSTDAATVDRSSLGLSQRGSLPLSWPRPSPWS